MVENIAVQKDTLYEGAVAYAMFKNRISPCFNSTYIPVKVVKEYPTYYVCEVLDHKNKYGTGQCTARYKTTIDKHDISVGDVVFD